LNNQVLANESTLDNQATTNGEAVDKQEERPRNRRSPRHLRANGQRRRRSSNAKEQEQNPEQLTSTASTELENDAVEARYPHNEVAETVETKTEVVTAQSTSPEVVEQTTHVETEEIEKTAVQADMLASETVATDSTSVTEKVEEPTAPKTVEEPTAPESEIQEATSAEESTTEIQGELAFEQDQNEATKVVEAVEAVEAVEEIEVAADIVVSDETATIAPVESAVINEVTNETVVKEDKAEANLQQTKAPKPQNKTVNKSQIKDKKLARQVRKANRLSGRASAPMTKTETISIINDIPTDFMADSDRLAHQTSGRQAVIADARSRNSAQATNPS